MGNWLNSGQLGAALQSDLLVGLHQTARDFNCVGGMLFPVFCFVYWPFLVLLSMLGVILPAQRVEDDGLTFAQVRLGALLLFAILAAAFAGGVVWRSYSSAGLGALQW